MADNQPRTAEHTPDWWKSAVVYQIYPRSFCDSTGSGMGDIRGIISKLDHLAALGVDVVWMSPAYTSPQDDNGYDISDYQDIDPLFGSLADVDELIEGLHSRGMKLVMDLVVNHTSDEHPWFVESRDPNSAKADWYWWRDPRPGFEPGQPGAEPTNWASAFSGPSWQWDEQRGQYFLHIFSKKQPDLNWENPEVRRAVYDMMQWWVDRGVDGFRMDVINLISKSLPLTDGVVVPGQALSWDNGYVDGPRMDEFLHEMNQAVLDGQHLLTVGECPGVSVEQASRYTDPERKEVGMVFQFEHVGLDEQPGKGKWALKPLHLPDLKANFAKWQHGLEGRGWNSLYWNNHDQPRIVSRWGDDSPEHRVNSAKTLGTVLHLQKGTPYIYQGEEIGMTNAYFTSIDQYQDLETLNHYAEATALGADPEDLLASYRAKSRDNARTPMVWDGTEKAGFTTSEPWLEINPNHTEVNVAAAVADPDSVFHHYRKLIALRHDEPVVRDGVFALLEPEHEQLFAYTRTLAGEPTLLVLANMSSQPCPLPQSCRAGGELLLGTHGDGSTEELAPWESRVIRLA
ncbi:MULTISPECIES: alpha-glucosidase [unclassified Luteococcus]|uniref:alpha-glucosidase n=1 Tax=unclassified Luteococcus TaxID=2639923 RepID=UPI00313C3587